MVAFVILLIVHTTRIVCADRHTDRQTHTHTHTRDNYCNPLCACAPRVNNEVVMEWESVVNRVAKCELGEKMIVW